MQNLSMERKLKQSDDILTPSPIKNDMEELNFPDDQDDMNSDLRDFQSMPPLAKNPSDEDGLPTILEQSTQEQLQPIKSRTHFKKQSEQIDMRQFQTSGTPDNLTALRMQYKHKRMQSKNALVNHYRSLSLMAGDDFSKALQKSALRNDND